jgi:hypothetical protein
MVKIKAKDFLLERPQVALSKRRCNLKTTEVVRENLGERIRMIEIAVKSVKDCLKAKSYLQCAVCLDMIIQHATFDEFTLNILDSVDKMERLDNQRREGRNLPMQARHL